MAHVIVEGLPLDPFRVGFPNPYKKPVRSDVSFDPVRVLLAGLFLLSCFLWWAVLVAAMSVIQLPISILAIYLTESVLFIGADGRPRKLFWKKYRYNLWITQDQAVNAIHGGNIDIHLSSRMGYNSNMKQSKTFWYMERFVNWFFLVIFKQDDHCWSAIEFDEVHVTDFGGSND